MKWILFALLFTLVSAKIDTTKISVSGLSSGAFFATQYQVAYSSSICGAAIFAGGPFYCAQDSLLDAYLMCMGGTEAIPLATLEQSASQFADNNVIDQLENLTEHRVYLYSGLYDTVVNPNVVKALEQMYRDWNVSSVVTEYNIGSAHTYPTLDYGNDCAVLASPYIGKCSYDGAAKALTQIYGPLNPAGSSKDSNIIQLSQQLFTPGSVSPSSLSLGDTAYLYVPTACSDKTTVCKLHVAFHGCQQSYSAVNMAFIEHAGYNTWAESNNIIVAYPQTIASMLYPVNAQGCWDWWGYLDANYATQKGLQMQTMKNMVDYIIANM